MYLYILIIKTIIILICKCCNYVSEKALTQTTRYTQNGILHMLDRNKRIKANPERFQEATDEFDLIITAEERVFDQVIERKFTMITILLMPYVTTIITEV